jgi:hypothetical protein
LQKVDAGLSGSPILAVLDNRLGCPSYQGTLSKTNFLENSISCYHLFVWLNMNELNDESVRMLMVQLPSESFIRALKIYCLLPAPW